LPRWLDGNKKAARGRLAADSHLRCFASSDANNLPWSRAKRKRQSTPILNQERALFTAVLEAAIRDTTETELKVRQGTLDWRLRDKADFAQMCELTGLIRISTESKSHANVIGQWR
jgi:hypothetical protein